MGNLSVFARNKLLDHIYKTAYTPASTLYLSLFVGDPAGAGAEASGNNYAPTAITFGTAASRRVTQDAIVSFPQASGSWGGTIDYYAIRDAASGNILATGQFTTGFTVVSGNTPKIASGQCYVEISATAEGAGLSTFAANKLLDLMFNATAWATPKDSLYIAMSHTVLDDADATSSDFTEQTGTGYSRTNLPSASMAASSLGATTNSSAVSLASPTGSDWTSVVALAIMDASTAGNIIAYDSANVVDQTPASGDPIEIAAGAFDHALT